MPERRLKEYGCEDINSLYRHLIRHSLPRERVEHVGKPERHFRTCNHPLSLVFESPGYILSLVYVLPDRSLLPFTTSFAVLHGQITRSSAAATATIYIF